jgi:hypothetical protein
MAIDSGSGKCISYLAISVQGKICFVRSGLLDVASLEKIEFR